MRTIGVGLALAFVTTVPTGAAAAPSGRVEVPRAVDASCSERTHAGAGTAHSEFRARATGYLTARLDAARGDWDLAVFRPGRPEPVTASAYSGAHEVASGFVRRGERLTVRACRRSGPASRAHIRVQIQRMPAGGRRDATRARARAAVRVRASALPSGRTDYRRLVDYGNEMKALAAAHPDLVKPITLPLLSRHGRPIEALEIATSPHTRDGRPVYLQLGLHHANEWPSGEHPLEFAHELINAYRAGDSRTVSLMTQVRTIVVPVVNPDGFNFSREAAGTGTGAESHRKNCPSSGCAVNQGVDSNRNYGDLWGGIGSSASPTHGNYHGTAPFSEPEVENIRRLISGRQVVMLITNHTSGRLILRQPSSRTDRQQSPDEPLYRSVGAAMAAENGYANIFSYQLYDHVGTTDGWSYNTTGALSYVFEAQTSSHPAYADVVQEYEGTHVPGDGNREAFYIAMESAANRAHHAVLTGDAPPGAVLRLTKSFRHRVSVGQMTSERFDTTMEVPPSGRFEWHVNQSSRPLVPGETWTLTCEQPEGSAIYAQQIAVARGQSLAVSACAPAPSGESPPPAADPRPKPRVAVRLAAVFDGRRYRVRMGGRLRNVADLERCDGVLRLTLVAGRKHIATRRAGLDESCRFARRISFRPRALPPGLRRRGARLRLRVTASWPGNEFLQPATAAASKRVRRLR